MKQTRLLMGMPITIEVADTSITKDVFEKIFSYFEYVDTTFSTYKKTSQISQLNQGRLSIDTVSADVRYILHLAQETKMDTKGYFDIEHDGFLDPSGIVKGWAITNAAHLLKKQGFANFYIDAGGDIEVSGKKNQQLWRVGIRNPFNRNENVKVVALTNCGIATSGTAIRGQHIYNPFEPGDITNIVSMTVIGPTVYEADRFATAAFAMGKKGIQFIEQLDGFEGYMIDNTGVATYTKLFERFVV